jgi:hypothetical protein
LRFVESQDALRDQLSAYKKEAADTQKRISDREEAVQKIHSEAREKVDAAISAAKSQFEAVATEAAATLRTQEAEYVSNAEGVIKALEEQQKKAGRVVALIGGAGMADGYNAYADSQTTAAFRWNLAAVVLGVAAVIYLAVALWDLRVATEVPSPAVIVLKSAVSITGLSVAGYMARIASNHRKQAVKAKFRAMDLVALGPFTEELAEEQKQTLVYGVGVSAFIQDADDEEKRSLLSRGTKKSMEG